MTPAKFSQQTVVFAALFATYLSAENADISILDFVKNLQSVNSALKRPKIQILAIAKQFLYQELTGNLELGDDHNLLDKVGRRRIFLSEVEGSMRLSPSYAAFLDEELGSIKEKYEIDKRTGNGFLMEICMRTKELSEDIPKLGSMADLLVTQIAKEKAYKEKVHEEIEAVWKLVDQQRRAEVARMRRALGAERSLFINPEFSILPSLGDLQHWRAGLPHIPEPPPEKSPDSGAKDTEADPTAGSASSTATTSLQRTKTPVKSNRHHPYPTPASRPRTGSRLLSPAPGTPSRHAPDHQSFQFDDNESIEERDAEPMEVEWERAPLRLTNNDAASTSQISPGSAIVHPHTDANCPHVVEVIKLRKDHENDQVMLCNERSKCQGLLDLVSDMSTQLADMSNRLSTGSNQLMVRAMQYATGRSTSDSPSRAGAADGARFAGH
ncbi:hypothetical protein CYLTODRAFT_448518 [Cylindrobasidium torrendii FP15055 ss-10]|uniref:Uncharacterized protein n=1 Tax=Cylindrobasidium torrendii FP15055 ss-10 TaxID=1314674 RepID=A0A0D7BUJ2_9AGAR|nr:hypothetical protein CYLTODRAFT_448518 [Cylindrobasidium torrendii FP15055 ss-10]